MAKVLGVGGIFFKSKDCKALADWYARWLNMPIDPEWGGAALKPGSMPKNGYTVWGPFKADTSYFAPSEAEFMVNLVVDDLDAALRQVAEGGAQVMKETQEDEFGRFGWFVDPQGTKVELWEPPASKSAK